MVQLEAKQIWKRSSSLLTQKIVLAQKEEAFLEAHKNTQEVCRTSWG